MYHFEDYVHPLRNVSSPAELDDYPFPDVLADYRWEGITDRLAEWHERGYAIAGGSPHYSGTLFECPWILRGLENLLADFLLHLQLAAALLDHLAASGVEGATRLAQAGIDILLTGDDVGT